MSDYNTPAENTPAGAFGEFLGPDNWTDEEWAEYDRWMADDIAQDDADRAARWDEDAWMAEAALAQYDDDPNPYHGDYSEM